MRREGWFWRDNTKALAEMILSNNSKVVFTRPPRFGKTTFCKMIGAYVDLKPNPQLLHAFDGTAIDQMKDIPKLNELRNKCAWLELVSFEGEK